MPVTPAQLQRGHDNRGEPSTDARFVAIKALGGKIIQI